jgi:hypothetical protein
MRNLRWLLAVFACIAVASPAHANSIFFSYSGQVSSDVTVSSIPGPFTVPLPFGPVSQNNLTGQAFSISETFNLNNANAILNGSYIGDLGGGPPSWFASAEITIAGVSATLAGNFGTFTPTLGGFSSEVGTRGNGNFAYSSLQYSSTFTPNGTIVDASLMVGSEGFSFNRTLDFNVTSETFAVSAVPLPPAFPMFASALLALGIFGFYARKNHHLAAS